MGSSSREDVAEVFGALDTDLDRLCELSFDALTTPERLRLLERVERVARRLWVPQHAVINQLAAQASEEELGAKLASALSNRLRVTSAEAGRRIAEAEDLGERRALTGEPLAPQLTQTATAQREGTIGDGHVKVIRTFFHHLPDEVDLFTRGRLGPLGRVGRRASFRRARRNRPGPDVLPQPRRQLHRRGPGAATRNHDR